MSFGIRIVATLMTLSLFAAGPFAPVVIAQAPIQPAAPAAPSNQPTPAVPAPPSGQTVQPGQPDMFKEAVKPEETEPHGAGVGYNILAGIMTFFLIPGRIGTCAAGTGIAVVMFATSFGSGYQWATRALEEGCGGKWVLRGEDLLPDSAQRPVVADAP